MSDEIESYTSHALRRGRGTDAVQAKLLDSDVRIGANIKDPSAWKGDYYHQSVFDLAAFRRLLPFK